MTIEVRQMLIRSRVGEAPPDEAAPEVAARALERLRSELLAELRIWLDQRQREHQER
jgi:Family of unknown function (DUF5908)